MHLNTAKRKVFVVMVLILTFIGQATSANFISCQMSSASTMDHAMSGEDVHDMSNHVMSENDLAEGKTHQTEQMSTMASMNMDCCDGDKSCPLDSCPIDSVVTAVLLSDHTQARLSISSHKTTFSTLLALSRPLSNLYHPPIVS
jgi:hypothetical protein